MLLAAFLLLGAGAACGSSSGSGEGKNPASDRRRLSEIGVVLQGKAALGALDQCSRSTPKDVRETWTPSAAEIRVLEAKLGPVLDGALKKWLSDGTPPPPVEYLRQYVGVVHRDGTRSIYVNGFLDEALNPAGEHRDTTRWREEPVVVCDGGAAFFGVEYHPGTGTFGAVEFNGIA